MMPSALARFRRVDIPVGKNFVHGRSGDGAERSGTEFGRDAFTGSFQVSEHA